MTYSTETVLGRHVHQQITVAYESLGSVVAHRFDDSSLVEEAFAKTISKPLRDFYELVAVWLKHDASKGEFRQQAERTPRRDDGRISQRDVLDYVTQTISALGSEGESLAWAVSKPLQLYWRGVGDTSRNDCITSAYDSLDQSIAEWIAQIPLPLNYAYEPEDVMQRELGSMLQKLSKYPNARALLAARASGAYGARGLTATY